MQKEYSKEGIKEYWVGLMEGGGSIQVNHRRRKNIQYRLIIKIKYTQANEGMLKEIATKIGGGVKRVKSKEAKEQEWVQWVENDRQEVGRILEIMGEYPPITKKMACQLEFIKWCMEGNPTMEEYIEQREKKYENKGSKGWKGEPSYFNIWLSGYTEASGSFTIRQSKTHSYIIGQKEEREVLEGIRKRLGINASVREATKKKYNLETSSKEPLERVISQYETYPLLGEKRVEFERWKQEVYKKKEQQKHKELL